MQAGHRHVELGFLGVFEHEEFGGLALDFQGDQAVVAADAVVDVHHRRAFAQLGEVLDHVVAAIADLVATAALHDPVAEQRAFRNQRQFVEQQTLVQRRDGDRQAFAGGDKTGPAVDLAGLELEAGEQFQQGFAAAGRLGAEQHAAGVLLDEAAQGGQWLAGLGLDRQVGQDAGGETLAADAGLHILLVGDDPRPAFQAGEAVFHRQEQLGRWQQRAFGVDAAFLVAVAHVAPELLGGLLDAGQGEYLGIAGQVVEQGGGLLEEQWQVVLDAGRGQAAGQVLVQRAAPVVDVETLAKARAEGGHRLLLHRELAGRQQAHRVDLVDRALGLRVEGAQGFDLVVEQVDAIG
ncbi:hypothetical protein D3C85_596470 [compost metagenome]